MKVWYGGEGFFSLFLAIFIFYKSLKFCLPFFSLRLIYSQIAFYTKYFVQTFPIDVVSPRFLTTNNSPIYVYDGWAGNYLTDSTMIRFIYRYMRQYTTITTIRNMTASLSLSFLRTMDDVIYRHRSIKNVPFIHRDTGSISSYSFFLYSQNLHPLFLLFYEIYHHRMMNYFLFLLSQYSTAKTAMF